MKTQGLFALTVFFSFLLTVLLALKIIPKLKSLKIGQKILEIGPRWHKSKEGTPTMGGIIFIIAIVITLAVIVPIAVKIEVIDDFLPLILTLAYALLCAAIGFIDDFAKIRKKQNEGLTAGQKYLLQLFAAGIYLFFMKAFKIITTELYIPFLNRSFELGIFYYVIMLILLTGIMNSTNLTDGIDGLAASVTLIVAAFFAICGFLGGFDDISILSAAVIGGCLGFLMFNFHPARVFMGDTGSLFLGGMVSGLALMLNNPLIIVLVGIVYIIETASVMLQVSFFKLTHGKRIFLMTPIHHHFEKKGWGEIKIVSVFSFVTLIALVAALFGTGLLK